MFFRVIYLKPRIHRLDVLNRVFILNALRRPLTLSHDAVHGTTGLLPQSVTQFLRNANATMCNVKI